MVVVHRLHNISQRDIDCITPKKQRSNAYTSQKFAQCYQSTCNKHLKQEPICLLALKTRTNLLAKIVKFLPTVVTALNFSRFLLILVSHML